MRLLYVVLLLPLILPAFAQSNIGIQQEDKIHNLGDTIYLDGFITNKISDHPVLITVTNPLNTTTSIAQIPITSNNQNFDIIINTNGDFYKYEGIYQINISYYTDHITTSIIIEDLDKDIQDVPYTPPKPDIFKDCIVLADTKECISYIITPNNTLKSIKINDTNKSLIINVDTNTDGFITLVIPPTIQKGIYMVTINDKEIKDIIFSDSHQIIIPFDNTTNKIEIFGTFVIPEFGFSMFVITLSLIVTISILTITKKNRIIYQ